VRRAPIKAGDSCRTLSVPSQSKASKSLQLSSQPSFQTSTFQVNTRGSSTQPGHFIHPGNEKLWKTKSPAKKNAFVSNGKEDVVNEKKTWKY
jgi:hypothetical protein